MHIQGAQARVTTLCIPLWWSKVSTQEASIFCNSHGRCECSGLVWYAWCLIPCFCDTGFIFWARMLWTKHLCKALWPLLVSQCDLSFPLCGSIFHYFDLVHGFLLHLSLLSDSSAHKQVLLFFRLTFKCKHEMSLYYI